MTRPINTVIVEDMPIAASHLKQMLAENCPNINVIATYSSGKEAIKHLPALNYDLLFLDIEYNDGYNAFRLLEDLDFGETHIIFTTAHEQYRKEAADVDSIKYLLKPIKTQELVKAVERSQLIFIGKEKLKAIEEKHEAIKSGKLMVNTDGVSYFLEPADIVYLEASGTYTYIYYISENQIKKILSTQNIGKFEMQLTNQNFLRVHKKYLVHIKFIESSRRNKLTLSAKNENIEILISKDRRKQILESISLTKLNL
jgi:two-component system LytT family response regulator